MANESQLTKVITGIVRFSYVHVFEPTAIEAGGKEKYSVSLIIAKSDKPTINAVKKAVAAATEAGKAKFGNKIPANLKLPLRDGDEERPDDEAYANSYFLNASCNTQPGLVDKHSKKIMKQEELYSGCYGHASITFYAFNTNGNKGIACGLNNLMKVRDGESLGGRISAEEDFAAVEVEDDSMLD